MPAAVIDPVRRPRWSGNQPDRGSGCGNQPPGHQGSHTPKAIRIAAEPNVATTNNALRMTVSFPRKHQGTLEGLRAATKPTVFHSRPAVG